MTTGLLFTRNADGSVTILCDPSVPIQSTKDRWKELLPRQSMGEAVSIEMWDSSFGLVRRRKLVPVASAERSETKERKRR